MDILLANMGEHISSPPSPPLGVISLAGWVRSRMSGVNFRVIDQRIEEYSYATMVKKIIDAKPSVVGLSYMTPASPHIPRITRQIKESLPDTKIFLGGPHPSAAEAAALEATDADAMVIGEGEISFEMMLERLRDGSSFDDIPGLIYRNEDGEVVTNPGEGPHIEDLDGIPFLAYDLIDLPRYWPKWSQTVIPPPRNYITLFTSRGCPYRCIYCHDVFGKTFKAQSAERIVEEIKFFQKQYPGIKGIDFLDDIWNLDKSRVFRFNELIHQNNIKTKFTMANGIRTDILTEEVADAMVDAGVYVCGFALESGSKRIQKLIKKNLNIDKFLAGVEMMANRRVFTFGLNIFGFPTETREEMQMTIDTASASRLHVAYFFNATPYPGTGLWDAAMEICPEKVRAIDYADHNYSVRAAVNLSSVSDEEMNDITRQAVLKFFANPNRLYRIFRDSPARFTIGGTVPVVAVTQAMPGVFKKLRTVRKTLFLKKQEVTAASSS